MLDVMDLRLCYVCWMLGICGRVISAGCGVFEVVLFMRDVGI